MYFFLRRNWGLAYRGPFFAWVYLSPDGYDPLVPRIAQPLRTTLSSTRSTPVRRLRTTCATTAASIPPPLQLPIRPDTGLQYHYCCAAVIRRNVPKDNRSGFPKLTPSVLSRAIIIMIINELRANNKYRREVVAKRVQTARIKLHGHYTETFCS